MDFSVYSGVWHFFVQLGIIFIAVLIGNIIRRKVKFVRNSLIPSSVLAGIIIFIFKFIPSVNKVVDSSFMELITYHALGLGFIALGLKSEVKSKDDGKLVVLDSGIITVNGYFSFNSYERFFLWSRNFTSNGIWTRNWTSIKYR